MKIDKGRLKKSTSEVPAECQALISKLRGCDHKELMEELKKIDTWTYGKCELYHWIDILDIHDTILEKASAREGNSWTLACDLPENAENKEILLWTLHFTTLLIEHSFSRHLYSSMEHLITLLQSCDLNVVLGVLNLLYMFSKRSNFLTRLPNDKRNGLLTRLIFLAETWGGKENGFGLADCSRKEPAMIIPKSVTTLDFEFYVQQPNDGLSAPRGSKALINMQVIHLDNIDKMGSTPSGIMDSLMTQFDVPEDRQVQLFTRLRLACNFSKWSQRLLIVQARLQALSVLVYSNALSENAHSMLYGGLLEELVELLELQLPYLMEIRAAALRTLTSIIHLDRNPHFPKKPGSRLGMIIEVTGASSYHGFLPALVRTCIGTLTSAKKSSVKLTVLFPLPLATALFSFLYHLASYEAGGEALVSCGMMESLLRVINWLGKELEHITFVTRAVRVIDLITNMDMQAFQIHGGLSSFIRRLEMEVNVCRMEQPFEIVVPSHFNEQLPTEDGVLSGDERSSVSEAGPSGTGGDLLMQTSDDATQACSADGDVEMPSADAATQRDQGFGGKDVNADGGSNRVDYGATATSPALQLARLIPGHDPLRTSLLNSCPFPEPKRPPKRVYGFGGGLPDFSASKTGKTCLPQRAALLKSMLNFLKKAIQDPAFSDSIRHVMEGTLPSSLRHIISNAEYYGPSLFLLATDVVTVYVFQEPSLLSSLQDNGLTDVVLHALLIKDVPATREVLGSLPNVFSALCLNARGLESFVKCEPFERLFKVLLSPAYLTAMRRRRSSDPLGDTASNLGNAMDELMRHQPSLKVDATYAMIRLLEELNSLGNNPNYVCWRATKGVSDTPTVAAGNNSSRAVPNDTGSSDDEDEDEDEASSSSHPQREDTSDSGSSTTSTERTPIALIDYIVNVMKFIDAILSNNSTDDHCKEFIAQNGLPPLMAILALKNLPVDYPITVSAQAVASVCKSILNLAHEPNVLNILMLQMSEMIEMVQPLHDTIKPPGGSILLRELANAPNLETAFSTASATPLLHAVNAMHSYITTFIHTCRTGQSEIRAISLRIWGCGTGIEVITGLSNMYVSVVWESNILLALCTDDVIPLDSGFAAEDLAKLRPRADAEPTPCSSSDAASNGMTTAMEALSTDPPTQMDVDESIGSEKSKEGSRILPTPAQLKYIKLILAVTSRLARSLAELFGLLVKLCMGSNIRARRSQPITAQPLPPSPHARAIAGALNKLLAKTLSWDKLPPTVIPKFTLTFLICSIGFASPMLFDDKKYPYHLMLHKFLKHGGQQTFFNSIRWALSAGNGIDPSEGIEHPDLPEGTGDYLVSSLTLLEKLVNPKAILESPHGHSAGPRSTFDTIKYLMNMHQEAFKVVMLFWGKKPLKGYTDHMCDSMLSILRHILRGEKLMLDRLDKERISLESGEPGTGVTTTSGSERAPRAPEANVNPVDLVRLLEMGFPRAMCVEALLNTVTVDQAMDHILSGGAAPYEGSSEEEQMHQAVLMSLGVSTKPVVKSRSCTLEEDYECIIQFQQVVDAFTNKALSTCLELLDLLPDSVFRVCDLLVTITKRNGEEWREDMLDGLIVEICHKCEYLMHAFADDPTPSDLVDDLVKSRESQQFAVRIHLFTLLFEGPLFNEMRLPCALAAQNSYIIPMLVRMVYRTQEVLTLSGQKVTPKWLAPVLLLIDQYEQISTVTKRKERMHQVTNRIWRWFDLSTGKWTAYSLANNKLINEAYWGGFNTVRISCGRRRYTIQFHVMMQVNEESGNRRPIMMSLIEREKAEGKPDKKADTKEKIVDTMDVEEEGEQRTVEEQRNVPITGLQDELAKKLVGACVGLLSLPVDKHAVHAVMRVCLRLTQDYENAIIFANKGGIASLLGLTTSESFVGFLNLATLLIRHVIEEPGLLGLAMEKVLRVRTLNNIPPPYKELVYLLRNTSAAVTRDPQTFLEVARKVLRIDCNVARRSDSDDKDNGLLLKTLPPSAEISPVAPFTHEVTAGAINQLLNALARCNLPVKRAGETDPPGAATATTSGTTAGVSTNLSVAQNPIQLARPPNAFTPHVSMIFSTFRQNASHILGVTDETIIEREFIRKKKDEVQNTEEEKQRLLLPKSAILKLLADTVRSYAGCAKLIVDHMYYINQSDVITEDTTALAFVLDNLLPGGETSEDRECSTMSRMLIASIASCNHSPDAQGALVSEVRNSLVRAFGLPESAAKHTQIQLLSALISTMVESCPQNPPTPTPTFNHMLRVQPYGHHVNNIVKIIFRCRLFTDLARVAHHLDLSSPHMAATLNASMKPLETVSRIINQPTASVPKPKPKNQNAAEPASERPNPSESSRSNGETDMDIHVASGSRIPAIGDERISLNRMVNALLERVPEPEEANYEEPEPRPIRPMEIDTDTDHNPNAGLNDSNPLFDNNPVAEDPEDTQGESSESESESNEEASDGDAVDETREVEDDEEDDGDDNEEEDEEEEEEEEEGGSGYDDDGLEFFQSDEGLFRIPGLDRENEDILMIQYSDTTDTGVGSLVPWNSSAFPLPFGIFEDPSNGNGNDSGDGGLVDGLVNHTTPPHPLLLTRHHLESVNVPVGPRSQRISANRQRRYQFLHLNARHPNPPVILQRLLGPAGHNVPAHIDGGPPLRDIRDTRVVVMDNGLGLFSNEEEQIDFVDQSGYLFGPGLSATLNNPPTALHWWIEEAKLLDGESQPDCVVAVANELIPELEKHRESELVKRRVNKCRRPEDEEEKTVKDSTPPIDLGHDFIHHVSMEIPSTSTSVPRPVPNPAQEQMTTVEGAIALALRDNAAVMETMQTLVNLDVLGNGRALVESPPSDQVIDQGDISEPLPQFLNRLNNTLREATAQDQEALLRRRSNYMERRDPRMRTRSLFATPEVINDQVEGEYLPTNEEQLQLTRLFVHYTPPLPPFVERHFSSRPDSAESPPLPEDRRSSPNIPPPPPLIPVEEMIYQRVSTGASPFPQSQSFNVIPPTLTRSTIQDRAGGDTQNSGLNPFAESSTSDAEGDPFAMTCETTNALERHPSPPAHLITPREAPGQEFSPPESSEEARWNARVISPILSSRRPRPGARANRTNRPMRDTAADSRRATPPWRRYGPSWTWARPDPSVPEPRQAQQQDPSQPQPQQPDARQAFLDAELEDAVMRICRASHSDTPDEIATRVVGWPHTCRDSRSDPVVVPEESDPEQGNRRSDSQNVSANDSQESVVCLGSMRGISPPNSQPNEDEDQPWSLSQESVICLGSMRNGSAPNNQDAQEEQPWSLSQDSVVCLDSVDDEIPFPSGRRPREYHVTLRYGSDGRPVSPTWSLSTATTVHRDVQSSQSLDDTQSSQSLDDAQSSQSLDDAQSSQETMESQVVSATRHQRQPVQIVDDTLSLPDATGSSLQVSEDTSSHCSEVAGTQSTRRVPQPGDSTSPILPTFRPRRVRGGRNSAANLGGNLRLPRTSRVRHTPIEVDRVEQGEIVNAVDGPSTSTGVPSEVPEGVDPSFLAALPEEMRHEVISEHLQLQRILQQTQAEGEEPLTDVNPEFLAALPPSIQEEVLAQQRQELQRQAAIAANPDDPVDAAAFFENLPGPLRQAILTDMEDSQIAVLPPDLALEAQNLRREWESRNRQAMQDRILSQQHSNTALTSILRNSGAGRGPRYTFHTVPTHGNSAMTNGWHSRTDPLPASTGGLAVQGQVRVRGRHLLDHESLSCLMVLLFVDEPKLNTGRLHRVLRNLCYHSPTRDWVVKTLISIMERCNESRNPDNYQAPPRRRMSTRSQGPANQPFVPTVPAQAYVRTATPSWLNISLEAALGCRASVFSITRNQGKRASKGQESASIHPHASPLVFRHSLEALISLAKSFPGYFLPHKKEEKREGVDQPIKTYPMERDKDATTSKKDPIAESKKPASTPPRALRSTPTDFWENLVKLDSPASYKKGKTMARSTSILMVETTEPTPPANFETCAFGLLIQMLASPVVKRSTVLTDKLLRLLSLISVGLPDCQNFLTVFPLEGTADEVHVQVIVMPERHLRLAVEVLTSKSCSEDGLEDITALLLNLSTSPETTRLTILRLLLEGAKQLANVVKENIATLLVELKAMNEQMKRESLQDPETNALDRERPIRGVVNDRFTKTDVVVSAPAKLKGGCDLQLPSMAVLTTKTSSQAFFLRILKIIVQIRENMLPILKKKREQRDLYPTLMPNCKDEDLVLPPLSEQLPLDSLWETLGDCLTELNDTPDHHAVLVLQPAVEAFFIVHAALTEERPEPVDQESSVRDPDPEENAEPSESASPTDETPTVIPETVSTSTQPEPSVSERANQSDIMPQASLARNVAPVSPLQSDGESQTLAQKKETASQFFMRSSLATLGISLEQSQTPMQLPPDQQKFLKFAETHRTVLNQILRQSSTHLADGPFAVLVDHTRVLDFDVKRRYFRAELERKDEGVRREELAVHVRRSHVFEDSFRELHRRTPDEWKNRFYIVFEGEEGQDAGGLLREWYVIISREIFNPMYALFTTSHSDRVTYMINPASHCNPNHLSYFKFVGRVIAKAVYDNKLLECYFTRSFYKHILGILVKFSDMESEDYSFYQGLIFLMENNVKELGYELMFTAEVQVFGAHETRDLMPGGSLVRVTEENKLDYVRLVCKMKMADAIRKQIQAFLEGFYEIIPKRLIAIFNEQELELLISGLPNIDIEDLRSNTEYHKYQPTSLQIQWFWRALRSFDQADRAKFLQFVTGTSKVPLQGFGSLEGMNGVQKFQIHRDDRSTDRLPSAHTCFNQLDLPVYETYVKLSTYLLKAIHECSEGFGFA